MLFERAGSNPAVVASFLLIKLFLLAPFYRDLDCDGNKREQWRKGEGVKVHRMSLSSRTCHIHKGDLRTRSGRVNAGAVGTALKVLAKFRMAFTRLLQDTLDAVQATIEFVKGWTERQTNKGLAR